MLALPSQSPVHSQKPELFEQDIPGAVQTMGTTRELWRWSLARIWSLVDQMAVLGHQTSQASCFPGGRMQMPCLGFAGSVFLLSNAARDADEEMPQGSGRMKLN